MINERKLSKSELEKREDIIMKMKGNKRDLVKKYGKDAEAVMYGRATNMAKKKTENMRDPKITELIKDALKNPKKADLDKDGKLSSYEKTRGAAIEKNLKENEDNSPYIDEIKRDLEELDDKEANKYLEDLSKAILKLKKLNEDSDLESGQYGDPKVGNYDITSQNDNEAGDIEALSAAGLEEGTDNEMELKGQEMVDYIMKTWDWSEEKTLKFLADKFGNLKEDIDIGHQDNEPGMLQGDLYQVGKAAMEIYALLDDMEGEGEVDLPSWWQAKIFKAKEAIVGAAEYLDFELKEPAVDAVVDTVEPLEIEVDPLGETVEDYITSVDDLTEDDKLDESASKEDQLKIARAAFEKAEMNGDIRGQELALAAIDLINDMNESTRKDLGMVTSVSKRRAKAELKNPGNDGSKVSGLDKDGKRVYIKSIKDIDKFKDFELDADLKEIEEDYKPSHRAYNVIDGKGNIVYKELPRHTAIQKASEREDYKFTATDRLAEDGIEEGLPKGFFDKAMDAKDEVDEVAGYDRKGNKEVEVEPSRFKGRDKSRLREEDLDESYKTLVNKLKKDGKSEKAAKAIAGAVASYKAKGGGKGPTAKQK